jgi:hypothetical protein
MGWALAHSRHAVIGNLLCGVVAYGEFSVLSMSSALQYVDSGLREQAEARPTRVEDGGSKHARRGLVTVSGPFFLISAFWA